MTSPLPLFPTTVIGSMPRPQYLKDLLKAGSRTGEHDANWQRRMDDAYAKLKNEALAAKRLRELYGAGTR